MSNIVLVGSDVRVMSLTPNGYDGFPGAGAAINIVGVYKSVKLSIEYTRANVKPSFQVLRVKRVVDLDWTAVIENQVQSGGPLAMQMFLSCTNLIFQFQEESGGNYWTAYGGIQRGEYSVVNEERMETITVENTGPIGTSGYSLFYSSSPVSVSQAAQFALQGATQQNFTGQGFHG